MWLKPRILTLPMLAWLLQACLPTADFASFQFKTHQDKSGAQTRFQKFSQVMNNQCMNCHSNWFGGSLNPSEDQWLMMASLRIENRIIPGNVNQSEIARRIQMVQGSLGKMPPAPGSLSAAEIAAVTEWIASLPSSPPPPEPPQPPQPPVLTPFQKFEAVMNQRCMGCHLGTYPWFSSPPNEAAWINMSKAPTEPGVLRRITPGKADESTLYNYLLKPDGDLLKMPRGADPLTSEEQGAIRDWINSLPPNSSDGDTGNPSPPLEVGAPSQFVVRVMDRKAMHQWFITRFGPSIETASTNNILGRPGRFGGACDAHFSGTIKIPNVGNRPHCENIVSNDGIVLDAPFIPDADLGREGFRTMTCRKAVFEPGTSAPYFPGIYYALKALPEFRTSTPTQISAALAAQPAPSRDQLRRMYKSFMGGREPTSSLIDRLEVLAADAQESGVQVVLPATDRRLESWRYVLLALCYGADSQFY